MRATLLLMLMTLCCLINAGHAYAQFQGRAPGQDPRARIDEPRGQIINGGPGLAIINGYAGATLSLSYERFFGRHGLLSLTVPVTGYVGGSMGEWDTYEDRVAMRGVLVGVGLAFHPLGNDHVVDFSLGVIPTIGYGRTQVRHMDGHYNRIDGKTYHEAFSALLGQFAVTPNPSGRFRTTIYFNAGPVFSGVGPTAGAVAEDWWIGLGVRLGAGW